MVPFLSNRAHKSFSEVLQVNWTAVFTPRSNTDEVDVLDLISTSYLSFSLASTSEQINILNLPILRFEQE
jgi:hypothetical protein